MSEIVIVFRPDGTFRSLWDDAFPFVELGQLKATKTGSVAWNEEKQGWIATLNDGRQSDPLALRGDAVAWEQAEALRELLGGEVPGGVGKLRSELK